MWPQYTTGCLEFIENTVCRIYMKTWVFARLVGVLVFGVCFFFSLGNRRGEIYYLKLQIEVISDSSTAAVHNGYYF